MASLSMSTVIVLSTIATPGLGENHVPRQSIYSHSGYEKPLPMRGVGGGAPAGARPRTHQPRLDRTIEHDRERRPDTVAGELVELVEQLLILTSLTCFSQQPIFDDRIQYHAFVAHDGCGQVGLGSF